MNYKWKWHQWRSHIWKKKLHRLEAQLLDSFKTIIHWHIAWKCTKYVHYSYISVKDRGYKYFNECTVQDFQNWAIVELSVSVIIIGVSQAPKLFAALLIFTDALPCPFTRSFIV